MTKFYKMQFFRTILMGYWRPIDKARFVDYNMESEKMLFYMQKFSMEAG